LAKRVASAQLTLIDMNDITSSPVQPTNPTDGMIWMDTSSSPYKFYVYRASTGKFEPTGPINLEQLDPDAAQQVEDAYNGINDLGADNKLTRYERAVVRGDLATIVGKFLNNTDSMPSLATIDSSGVGEAYSIRKAARDIGMPTSNTAYVNYGNAYTALNTYLSGLNPKAWDIVSTATNTIVPADWEAAWNEYKLRLNLLNVEIQNRQQDYADTVGEGSVQDAIEAVSASDQYETKPLTNPVTITSPIASVALPEFEGKHADGWEIVGRNLVMNSSFANGKTGWTGQTSSYTILPAEDDKPNSPIARVTKSGATTNGYLSLFSNYFTVANGDEVTASVDIKIGDIAAYDEAAPFFIEFYDSSNTRVQYKNVYLTDMGVSGLLSGTWYRVSYKLKATNSSIVSGRVRLDLVKNGDVSYREVKAERNTSVGTYTIAPEESVSAFGKRIKPVTAPSFTSAASLIINGAFYGDGTNNDTFSWNTQGQAVKVKKWEDTDLDGSYNWVLHSDYGGFKAVKVTGFFTTVVDASVQAAKHNGQYLSTIITGLSTADQVIGRNSEGTLYITVSDADSGWGDSYTPTTDEIKAYFNGWKMCNGTFGSAYTGTGNKVWHPIGDTDLSRSTAVVSAGGTSYNPVPDGESLAITEQAINKYQLVYRLVDPIQEIVPYEGILPLIKGDNSISISYPAGTPAIVKGSIRYALNLATVTDILKYIVPVLQKRLSNAEEVIKDDSIVNTVMNSVEYTLAMRDVAKQDDLGQFVTGDEVDEKVKNGLDSLDFSPYITSTELEQTATNITAKFSATGGMNLLKNSVGYADRDFWSDYSATGNVVDTISNAELDTLGFGSGFQFNPDGNNKGIFQYVDVIPGQPYTLSWYLNKRTGGADSSYRFFIQIQENGVTTTQIADNSADTTVGYAANYFTFTPTANKINVRFIGYGSVDATLTGAMLTIGDVALQWSLATGEIYNTNIRMDVNGIRVSQLDADRKETGFTQITPDEFAGYWKDGNGTFQKVFYLNGDETVSTKLRAQQEITMGGIKVLNVNSGGWNGWAFVANQD